MKTGQAKFEETYHHIEAPTFYGERRSEHVGRRVLALPWEHEDSAKEWRKPELSYLAKNQWAYRRKLNSENMRVKWDEERAIWNGRTDDFACSEETSKMMNGIFHEDIFEEKFGREKTVLLFGERMEPKNIVAIAKYFKMPSCYDFMPGGAELVINGDGYVDSLLGLIKKVYDGKFREWEGIIATPAVELFSRKGERLIVKIKNKDYLG